MLSTRSPTFKLEAVKPHLLPLLDDIAVIRLSGPDAEAFAQAQFMNDVAALAPGAWQWSGWLDAKGRIRALFALLRHAPGELLLLLMDTPAAPLCDELRRFVFRSKVRVVDEASLGVFATFDAMAPASDGAPCVDFTTPAQPRHALVLPRGEAQPDAMASRRWRDLDLAHGVPRVAFGSGLPWTPHMLSLDRLKAFSVRKGCYPGQEIVARTHFLGQSKRQLWWLSGEGLKPGLAVLDAEGQRVGEILEVCSDGSGGLAVATLAGPAIVKVGDSIVNASPPSPGLARPI